jgi:S-adenosylmethionine-diacylglycerol 3-amino-3-carboxypropyl transferase
VTESPPLADRVAFDRIRYANCWEDSRLLLASLEPAPGRRILSIASAGDNSLHLLAQGAEVVAADLNATQLACTELRVAAVCEWPDAEALRFLGFTPATDRLTTYAKLRTRLSPNARTFWDAHPTLIRDGVIHAGKFENYFRWFRTRCLPLVHRSRTVTSLLQPRDPAARQQFYEATWNTWRWRALFRIFFSRFVMGRLGRDPEFFRHVQGSVADRILERTRHALTTLSTHDNPYLRYILTGQFTGAMPDWTQPDTLNGIRRHADRLTLFHGSIEAAAAAHGSEGFDGFNLSDIFEYMDEATATHLYTRLLSHARPGARLAYWNMLAPRTCPPACRDRVTPLTDRAQHLWQTDRAFFYSAFHVDEVHATGAGHAG